MNNEETPNNLRAMTMGGGEEVGTWKNARRRCSGSGLPAVPSGVYPSCAVCGKAMAAQGRKAQRRFSSAWQQVPMHYVEYER